MTPFYPLLPYAKLGNIENRFCQHFSFSIQTLAKNRRIKSDFENQQIPLNLLSIRMVQIEQDHRQTHFREHLEWSELF